MTMLKKILIIMLFAAPMGLFAQATEQPVVAQEVAPQPTFGYLSYDNVFKAMPDYADAQESLNQLKGKYEAEIKRAEKEFEKKYSEFLQNQKELPEAILLRRQKELQQLMEKSIEFKSEIKAQLAKAQEEMTAPVTAKLNAAIKTIAEQHKLQYVLNTDNNNCPYINPACGLDLTAEVMAALGIAVQ